MLKLQFKDRQRESVWLVDERFTLGKAVSNSLVIKAPSIADIHAEIVNKSDQLSLIQKHPDAIIKVNNKDISGSAKLKANDTITLGEVELEIIDSKSLMPQVEQVVQNTPIWSLYSNASWLEKNNFVINSKTIIGRDAACDICLSLDYLSRQHVSLEQQGGKLIIEDLNSSNGTYVNGKKIKKLELKPGDKIKLDVLSFEVRGGPSKKMENDPHKTMIRTAPKNAAAASTRHSTQSRKNSQSSTAQPKQSTAKTTNKRRKHLVSKGKQDWISGDNQLKVKPERKKKKRFILAMSALVLITCGLIVTLMFLE